MLYGVIKSRRSVRTYDGREVPRDVLSRIFEAARWAPSAHNAQPWRFIVIYERDVKRMLARAMADAWFEDLRRDGVSDQEALKIIEEESMRRFTESPVLIVVGLTMRDMDKYPDERRMRAEYTMAIQSVAAAVQNILLAAHLEGLGACWVCAPLFCQEVVKKTLKLPEEFEPQAILTLGYPVGECSPPPRKTLSEIVWVLTSEEGLTSWKI
ncbi:nitroreductase family protein [Candidatus Bathyarchaeota archaeon]|nr:nitroreductase family protein [Candidatus Bathyarchaeota archaeon]MBS7618900.1 nitroreductase family protein [Candidatus Bathyarchaeota archaeon]